MKKIKRIIATVLATTMTAASLPMLSAYADGSGLDAVNGATSSNIASAVSEYLTEAGKNDLYDVLPECDKTEINKRILAGKPYADASALEKAYQTALEYATQADWSVYDKAWVEDFSGGLDANGWTSENLRTGAVGTEDLNGIKKSRETINVSGKETASAIICGGGLNPTQTKPSYIEKSVSDPKSIVTFYLKDLNNNNTTIGIQFNDKQAFSTKQGTKFDAINNVSGWEKGGSGYGSTVDGNSKAKWTKITLDGTVAKGKVNAYVDGELCYTFTGEIDRVKIGQLCDAAGFMVTTVDNISVAVADDYSNTSGGDDNDNKDDDNKDDDANKDKLAEFNSAETTVDTVKAVLEYTSKSMSLYSVLAECDQKSIVELLDKEKPFNSFSDLEKSYQSALEYATQADWSVYEKTLVEDFSDGLEKNGWGSLNLRTGAVGSGNVNGINKTRETINVSNTENSSAMILGGSLNNFETNGESYISKSIDNPNSIITFYVKDLNNNMTTIGIQFNDKQAFSTKMGSTFYAVSDVSNWTTEGSNYGSTVDSNSNAKWTKITIDGATESGKVKAYVDGKLYYTFTGEINQVKIGQLCTASGFMVATVDNVTVASVRQPVASNVAIKDNQSSLEVEYDYSHPNGVAEGSTRFQWYKKNDNGEFEKIDGATGKKYTFVMPDDSKKTLRVSVTPLDKNGIVGSAVYSEEFTESYMTSVSPTVTSAKISGTAKVNETLTVSYTATNATNSSKDKYRWYSSSDGTEWKLIEGANSKSHTLTVDDICKQIKCEVSVAGKLDTYSEWYVCDNTVTDKTSLIEMINAVQDLNSVGKNAKMLELLKELDGKFLSYSDTNQKKIAVKAVSSNINSVSDYEEIVESILNGTVDVDIEGIDFSSSLYVSQYLPGQNSDYKGFTDLDDASWAKEAITSLFALKVLSGRSDTLFCPNDNVTRAEFVVMVVNAFYSVSDSATHNFKDVEEGSWYEKYIATALSNGLVYGKSDNTFGPNDYITREEMAVICSRVIANGKCSLEDIREYTKFDDEASISEYAYDSIVSMYEKGIISGVGENRFAPQDLSTRAMAATMMYIMLGKPSSSSGTTALGDVVTEDFEDNNWIFDKGKSANSSVGSLSSGTMAYSGTGSCLIYGLNAAEIPAGNNRYFRIMIYDPNGKTGGMDAALTVETENGKFALGATTGKGLIDQGYYYQYYADGVWNTTGIIKSVGWHEFAIEFEDGGNVNMYIDGAKANVYVDDTNKDVIKGDGSDPKNVVIGNTDSTAKGNVRCYGDDFAMAKSKKAFDNAVVGSSISGNAVVTKVDASALPEKIRKKAGLINALNILSPDKFEELDKVVTREEFAYIISCMLNSSATESAYTGTQKFTDVASDRKTAGYIENAVSKGFITVDGSEFRPEEEMDKTLALKAMLAVLGYTPIADKFDEKWISENAGEAGLLDGVGINSELTWEEMINLIWNTLNATVLNTDFSGDTSFEISDVKYMNYEFDVYKLTDVVSGTYFVDTQSDDDLELDELRIGSLVVKNNGINANDFVGMEVNSYIYVNEDDDEERYTLVSIQEKNENSAITVNSRDIDGFETGKFRYADENRTKSLTLSKDLTVIKNGTYLFDYTEADFEPEIGTVRFVDSDSNGTYDVAIIMDYKVVKVGGYNTDKKILYDTYNNEQFDFYDTEYISQNGGGSVYPELFDNDSIILVAVSNDGLRADIISDTITVSGQLEKLTSDKAVVNGEEYYISEKFAQYVKENGLKALTLGVEGSYVIDAFGNIVGASNVTSASSGYAYLIDTYLDDSGSTMNLKMFTDNGVVVEYECDKKFKVNEVTANYDEVLAYDSQLIKYKLSSSGNVKSIELADTEHLGSEYLKGSEDNFWLYTTGKSKYLTSYNFGSQMYIKGAKVIIVPPKDKENDYDRYQVADASKYFKAGTTYNYEAYDPNLFNVPNVILVRLADNDDFSFGSDIVNVRMVVFNEMYEGLDEDDLPCTYVKGWQNNAEVEFKVKSGVDFNEVKRSHGYDCDWQFGDVFRAVTNSENELWEVYNFTKTQAGGSETYLSDCIHSLDDAYTNFADYKFTAERVNCVYGEVDRVTDNFIRLTDGENFFVIKKANFGTYVVDEEGEIVSKAASADLAAGKKVFVFAYHGLPHEIFIYNN